MAAIPCTFQGVLFFSDLGIGGGPMPGGPRPDQGLPGQPPGIWPSPGHPSHPIAPGGPPPGIWPSPGHPDQGLPGPQPTPTPPIYFPPEGSEPPLGIWGPTDPRPGTGLPGAQPQPEHPIVLPPDLPTEIPPEGETPASPIEWKTGWTQETGWVIVGVVKPDNVPHPTPSQGGQRR